MRRSRRVALAVALAAGFVAFRVLVRVVFGGAGGTGPVLVDLPPVRLAGPFTHLTLFGEVTLGGLAAAAASALPFAAVILVLGVLAAVLDVRALLARAAVRGPLRSLARALGIALATLPALVETVRRARIARELRGERGAAALLVPVLEGTVERAVALGAALEVRGFAASTRVSPACERPVDLADAAVRHAGSPGLSGIDLALTPGSLTLVVGATGSGKSTLLDALSGLLSHVRGGEVTGRFEVVGVHRAAVPPRETAGVVGVVAQRVRSSFVADAVADELGFGLVARGVAPVIVHARVAEVAHRLGITALLDRSVATLSAGEACLVAIGAAIVENPVLLVVDEPLTELDAAARLRVVDVLDRLAHEAGVAVVIAEHDARPWAGRVDAMVALESGRVTVAAGEPAPPTVDPVRAARPRAATAPALDPPALRVEGLTVSRGDRRVLDGIDLELGAGEVVALVGPNGAGKSTLLDALARPRGPVLVGGVDVQRQRPAGRRARIALVPEESDDLLFAVTVAEECRRADRRAVRRGGNTGGACGVTEARWAALLGLDDVDRALLRHRHPRDLSVGQRRVLALAVQTAAVPRVLLVDEPTRALDAAARALVADALTRIAATGTAVLVATHDADFAAAIADRTIELRDGRLRAAAAAVSPGSAR